MHVPATHRPQPPCARRYDLVLVPRAPRAARQERKGTLSRRAPLTRAIAVDTSLFKLPLFTSAQAVLPTTHGILSVFEPRYIAMFSALLEQGSQGPHLRFGHLIAPRHAPPQLLSDASINGWPKVGVLAHIHSITSQDDGTLLVAYDVMQRFQILSLLDTTPTGLAYCMRLGDHPPDTQADLDALERQVYQELREVVLLSRQLGDDSGLGTVLPEAVQRYAPQPVVERSLGQALIDAGWGQAGHSIAMWQRQGSVYDSKPKPVSPSHDPYQVAADRLLTGGGGSVRQELFSFAAAGCLDLGNPERLSLLNSRDTMARLAWVRAAIAPFRDELRAKAAVSQALGRPRTG